MSRVPIDFADSPEPTLGVEWEFALVDKQSRDLVNAASELFDLVSAPARPAAAHPQGAAPQHRRADHRHLPYDGRGLDELASMIDLVRPLASLRVQDPSTSSCGATPRSWPSG